MTNLLAIRQRLPRAAKQAHSNRVAAKAAAMAAEREEMKTKKAASKSAMAVNQSSRHAITRKAPRKNATPYARSSKNKANNISRHLHGLSFGKSSFTMKNFKNKGAPSYAPHFAPSSFVPLNQQQAFQLQMNEAVARQAAANRQHLANVAARRSLGAKKAAATRKARKEAAEAALRGAMEDVQEAAEVVRQQEQSANGVSPNAAQALAAAQLAAQRADEAFHRALLDIDLNENNGSASAASSASGNNLSSMFGRL
jgi:predicted ribosome quality control (RQC) complex YloA/Tae2 family protein